MVWSDFASDISHDKPSHHLVGSVVDYQEIDGYGELGFDSGEGAWEMATIS